ncbi:MAG: ankyrin repeat domain-containing protein [Bryobacterales bacterium]|nr:ankyrin repeat domain-containing protein [Bryobacterales bacterium]
MHKIRQTSVLPILVILIAVPLAAASPGYYPLHEAIRYSDLDRLTGFLQAGHDPDQADELGRTALHCALARLHG